MTTQQGQGKKSRTVATKQLIIQDYKRRLRDNIKSLNDNFVAIVNQSKIQTDDTALKNANVGRMTEFYTTRNEMVVRASLIVRAIDELQKLTNDLKEFLILHDFNFLTNSIKGAEKECDQKMKSQVEKHNALRIDICNLMTDIDKEMVDHFQFRH